jgi:hypothetical protein
MTTFASTQTIPNILRSYFSGPRPPLPLQHPVLSELAHLPQSSLPPRIQESVTALKYLQLLGPIDWSCFPAHPDQRIWFDFPALQLWSFAAACLVKLDQHQGYMPNLRQYLVENPALMWVLGFPLAASNQSPWGFDPNASLPTGRHFCRLLRDLPNPALQFLLDETVRLIQAELKDVTDNFGNCISLDTKHIIAWVKENNPKTYIEEGRFDKTRQPPGDPDCKLGCKRKKNQRKGKPSAAGVSTTPLTNPVPAHEVGVGEFYWGYGSGVVATKVDQWGEFVISELTQTFDHSDVSYFFPLMAETERRLGFQPKFGACDAAFDAFYIYDYFHKAGGFAAVPLVEKGKCVKRIFNAEGLPLCAADKPMPLKATYWDRTTAIIEYERGQYVCPLFFPKTTGETCPTADPHWSKGGCMTTLATSTGARLRHTLNREDPAYKDVYRQRTATERINSQAKEFGIESPKLRNQDSIRNTNTLIYVLINLHALQRIRQQKAECLSRQKSV